MGKKRLFIGIKIPDGIKKDVLGIKAGLSKSFPSIKWVKDVNLHITVIFLGYVEENKIGEVKSKIDELVKIKPFELAINSLRIYSGRVVLIGLLDNGGNFKKFQQNISKELKKLAVKAKTSEPHITLGRIKPTAKNREVNGLKGAVGNSHSPKGTITVNKISLFESKLTKEGPVYKQIAAFNLTP